MSQITVNSSQKRTPADMQEKISKDREAGFIERYRAPVSIIGPLTEDEKLSVKKKTQILQQKIGSQGQVMLSQMHLIARDFR